MPRIVRVLFTVLILTLLFGAPFLYAHYRAGQARNFRLVHDGVLFRSGQMSLTGLKQAVHDYGIRTVISLRDAPRLGELPPDRAEEDYCKEQDIHHFRLPPRTWWATDGSVPAEDNVRQFLEIMDNPNNYPVLIHCFAGCHRTGAYCAIYRMEYDHWANQSALREMKTHGYVNLDDEIDILNYLEEYRPRWKKTAAGSPRSEEEAEPPRRDVP